MNVRILILFVYYLILIISVNGRVSSKYQSLFKDSLVSELDDKTLLKQKMKGYNDYNYIHYVYYIIFFFVLGDPFLTMFYAPWCPHCQHYAPTWISIAQHQPPTTPPVRFFAVNCVQHPPLCSSHSVKGFDDISKIKGGGCYMMKMIC